MSITKTVKIKFVGKWQNLKPEDNTICYWLMKNGYDVQLSENPDYIICDIFGAASGGGGLFEYCNYPQIRIFECGENYIPDLNLMDYAICWYPLSLGDRSFYLPGCSIPGVHWHPLTQKDRNYSRDILREKKYFANLITSHDSENHTRSQIFEKLSAYKRVESPGTFLNNMSGGEAVDWRNESKTDFQRQCKFTICFESTAHYGFITEKITDAFFSDTIPIYMGSGNITDIFNHDAFLNAADYPSLDDLVEKVKELDQDDEKYLQMLRQPILVDPDYPRRLDESLEKFILHIFEQPYDQAYRRCRAYYPQQHNDFLASAIEPPRGYLLKQRLKKRMK